MAKKKSSITSLAGEIAVPFVGVTALIVIFASSSAWILGPIAAAFAVMGIGIAYFQSK